MAMRRILADGAFDQVAIDLMIEAYDAICEQLRIAERKHDPANETVALAVLDLVRDGERDVQRIKRLVVQSIQSSKTKTLTALPSKSSK